MADKPLVSTEAAATAGIALLVLIFFQIPQQIYRFIRERIRRFRFHAETRVLNRVARVFDARGRARSAAIGLGFGAIDGALSLERESARSFQDLVDVRKMSLADAIAEISRRMRRNAEMPALLQEEFLGRAKAFFDALADKFTTKLIDVRAALLIVKGLKRLFARENGLFHEPDQGNPVACLIGLASFAAIEMWFNFSYLIVSGAGDAGHKVVLVAATAAINIGIALVGTTVGVRELHHRKWQRRTIGGAVLFLSVCGCVALHLMLSHYRLIIDTIHLTAPRHGEVDYELLASKLDGAFMQVGSSVAAHPFAIVGDFSALLVFVLGLFFAGLAAWDVYKFGGDHYPGYARIGERVRQAEIADDRLREQVRESARAIIASERKRLAAEVRRGRAILNLVTDNLNDAINLHAAYEKRVNAIDGRLQREGEAYRDELRAISDAPLPELEQEFPPLDRSVDFDVDHYAEIEEKARQALNSLIEDAQRISDELTALEMRFSARIDEILGKVQLDAESKLRAEAELRDLSGLARG